MFRGQLIAHFIGEHVVSGPHWNSNVNYYFILIYQNMASDGTCLTAHLLLIH